MLKCVQIEHKIANAEKKDNTKKIKTLGNLLPANGRGNKIVIKNTKLRTQSDCYICYNAIMKKYR